MYLSMQQAAEMLGVSKQTIKRRVKDGSIKAKKLSPRCIRISVTEIERFVDSKKSAM